MATSRSKKPASENAKPQPPATVDEYLSTLPEDQRHALENLRDMVRKVVPEAGEIISYRIPTFRLGSSIVAMSASPNHCSLHLMSPDLMRSMKSELKEYSTTTSTIHFTPGKPLPEELVSRLVRKRIEEIEALGNSYRSKK